ncbi:MAG: MerC domain-containing protein [Pseudomonadota bacterium]
MTDETCPTQTASAGALPDSPFRGRLDQAGIGVAGLCLIHCLALPSLAALLPLIGVVSEAEWIHKALVLAALPIAFWAMAMRFRQRWGLVFCGVSLVGVGFLLAPFAVESWEALEEPLTITGALILFCAHLFWWRAHSARRAR